MTSSTAHPGGAQSAAADALAALTAGGDVELLSADFTFTDGPTWDSRTASLLFSDLPESVIYRYDGTSFSEFRRPSGRSNGLCVLPDGRLLSCEHDTSTITLEGDGSMLTVASHYGGKQLNSPNDVIAGPAGELYFTDPPFGRVAYWGIERPQELSFQGLFKIPAIGEQPVMIAGDFKGPNGLCLSPDGSRLYVSDTVRNQIRVFQVADDGNVTGGQVFFSLDRATDDEAGLDGMKCDEFGNVYCAGPAGIIVISPAGAQLGVLRTPGRASTSLTWGGADGRDLYITAGPAVYRIRMRARGALHA